MTNPIAPILTNENITMSSREIAELVESRHDSVKRTIERLADSGVIQLPPMVIVEDKQSLSPNSKTKVYVFSGDSGKRDSIIVVAQLSPEFTARLVDRWQELEAQAAKPIDPMQVLNDPAAMRGLLLTYTEKVLALESTVAEQAPKVAALERLSASEGSQCITDAAKALKMPPKKLFAFLQEKHWIYKRAGGKNRLGYQDKIQSGFIEHKITTITKSDGTEKTSEQALLTPKGITKLAGLVNEDKDYTHA